MNILTPTDKAVKETLKYGITFDDCVSTLSMLNNMSSILRKVKTKDNKKILLTINEGLEIYRTYGKNICDLPKKKVEEYLMVIRL